MIFEHDRLRLVTIGVQAFPNKTVFSDFLHLSQNGSKRDLKMGCSAEVCGNFPRVANFQSQRPIPIPPSRMQ